MESPVSIEFAKFSKDPKFYDLIKVIGDSHNTTNEPLTAILSDGTTFTVKQGVIINVKNQNLKTKI